MSLLGTLRQGIDNGTLKVLFFVLVVMFVFWGVGGNNGPQTQVIATVNGERITDTRYYKIMRNVDRNQGRQLEEDERNNLARRVLEELIVQELELQKIHQLRLEVSDKEIARQIFQIDAFKDEAGVFSEDLYERNLKRMGTIRAEFESDLRQQIQLSMLEDMVVQSVAISESDIKEWWRLEGTRIDLEVLRVPALNFYDDVEPTPAEIDTFIAENSAALSASYREHYEARYHKPYRVEAQMILLKNGVGSTELPALKARAQEIRKEAESGADFANLARKYSEDISAENGGDLGTPSAEQMDPMVANAIFGDKPEKVEPGIFTAETDRGVYLIKVKALLPEEIIPEEQVRSEIAISMIREMKAPGLASAFAEQARKDWETDSSPNPIELLRQGLTISRADSVSLADQEIPGFRNLPEVMKLLPGAQRGQVLGKVFASEESYFVFKVADRIEPAESSYASERERIQSRLLKYRQAQFLQEWRDDLVAQAKIERHLRLRGESKKGPSGESSEEPSEQ